MNHNPIPFIPNHELVALLRLVQILGNPKSGIPGIIPVSKSTWWAGVASGKFPKPIRISRRCVAWRASDINDLVESFDEEAA